MIKSMTGFGRFEEVNENYKILVEMKAVNNRYCDINTRLPKKYIFLEGKIRNLIKNYVDRGKIDVFITYYEYTDNKLSIKYNESLAEEYINTLKSIEERFSLDNDIRVSTIARLPEVLTLAEESTNEDEVWPVFKRAIINASEDLSAVRSLEGKYLQKDLLSKLDNMDEYISFIESKAPEIVRDHYNNLKEKVANLLGDTSIDESVLATEVATFADKVSIDEELVRLNSHIKNMRDTLNMGKGIGRKLDFIAQEMNREANTILSKVNDLEVTNVAIDLKTDIEKIREQVQNIE